MRRGMVVGIVAVVVLVACGEDGSESSDSTVAVTPQATDAPARSDPPSSDAVPTSGGTSTSTPVVTEPATTSTTLQLPDAVTVAALRPMSGGGMSSLLAHRDHVLEFGAAGGRLSINRSTADASARPEVVGTDVELSSVLAAASDGERIVLVGGVAAEPVPQWVTWTSSDDGATWQALDPIPLPSPTSRYAHPTVDIQAVAIGGGAIVALGYHRVEVDWGAFSREVLGEEHANGRVRGSSGGGSGIDVEFDDGSVLTVDPASVGVSTEELLGVTPALLTHDGTAWTVQPRPEWTPTGMPRLAYGPSGFATVMDVNASSGPSASFGPRLLLSPDGRDWEVRPLPDSLESDMGGMAAVTAGPLGYVVVGADVVSFSPDGSTWTDSDVFPRREASQSMTEPPLLPRGGTGGFVVFVPDNASLRSAGWAMWSPDGLAWTVIPLPAEAMSASAAVVSDRALIVPYSAPDPLSAVPETPADRTALEAVIASAFDGTMPDGSPAGAPAYATTSEAQCIARGVVDELGIARVRELKFGASRWHLLGYALSLPIDVDDAERIVPVFRGCTPNWDLLAIRTATEGTDRISEPSLECTRDTLDDDIAEELFVIELARPYDDQPNSGQPSLEHLESFFAALEECLTAAELAALDWS